MPSSSTVYLLPFSSVTSTPAMLAVFSICPVSGLNCTLKLASTPACSNSFRLVMASGRASTAACCACICCCLAVCASVPPLALHAFWFSTFCLRLTAPSHSPALLATFMPSMFDVEATPVTAPCILACSCIRLRASLRCSSVNWFSHCQRVTPIGNCSSFALMLRLACHFATSSGL